MFLTKNKLLKKKKQLTLGMIVDCEIEIEANWILMSDAEQEIEKVKNKITKNLEAIKEEKAKTPMDMEKVKELTLLNAKLGHTGKETKEGDEIFEGAITFLDNKRESCYAQVQKKVGEREHIKLQLKAINRMIKRGYHKEFDKFKDEELK